MLEEVAEAAHFPVEFDLDVSTSVTAIEKLDRFEEVLVMIAILRLIARQRQHLVRRRGEKKGTRAGCIVGIFEQSPC